MAPKEFLLVHEWSMLPRVAEVMYPVAPNARAYIVPWHVYLTLVHLHACIFFTCASLVSLSISLTLHSAWWLPCVTSTFADVVSDEIES
jgi:hypothetical protein